MKYRITEKSIQFEGRTLFRIQRVSDGLMGGFIEHSRNLCQEGACFVYNDAQVCGNVVVHDDAQVLDNAVVRDYALVGGDAQVRGDIKVFGHAYVNSGEYSEGVLFAKNWGDTPTHITGAAARVYT